MLHFRVTPNPGGEIAFQHPQSATHISAQMYPSAIWPLLVASIAFKNRRGRYGDGQILRRLFKK